MKICSNCKSQLSCGCQRRTASDGTSCCDVCINLYEKSLNPPVPSPSAKVVSPIKKESAKISIQTVDDSE